MGVSQSIADGYMGRCEMIWTTAGTNRVCGRCMDLKDTVVGHTDESGALLPPLHPRCRCAIMYREVGKPKVLQPKPKPVISEPTSDSTSTPYVHPTANPQPLKSIGAEHYTAIQIILANAPISKAAQVWTKFEDKMKIGETNAPKMFHDEGVLYLNVARLKSGESVAKPYQKLFHEGAHLIDFLNSENGKLFSEHYKGGALLKSIKVDFEKIITIKTEQLQVELDKKVAESDWQWLIDNLYASELDRRRGKISNNLKVNIETVYKTLRKEWENKYSLLDRADFSDIFSGYTNGRYDLGAGHNASYWRQYGDAARSAEAFAEFFDAVISNKTAYDIMKLYLPTAEKIFREMLDDLIK